jgi:hypothetical protein
MYYPVQVKAAHQLAYATYQQQHQLNTVVTVHSLLITQQCFKAAKLGN